MNAYELSPCSSQGALQPRRWLGATSLFPNLLPSLCAAGFSLFVTAVQAGSLTGVGLNNFSQTSVPPITETDISLIAGREFSLALAKDGKVVGWGHPGEGRAVPPENLSGVTSFSAGIYHSLARKADGSVVGWGFNGNKILEIPPSLSKVLAVAAGGYHSLALLQDGTVIGWGFEGDGRIAPPPALRDVVAIDAGRDHNVALKADGTVVAWGLNDLGQTSVPAGLADVIAISAGENHTLALKKDGSVVAWGSNGKGQCTVPTGLTGVVAISAGGEHSLALKSDGTVRGWGDNEHGQISLSGSNYRQIAAGGYHSLALRGTSPLITGQPLGQSPVSGSTVTFNVTASGTGLSYQWQFNGKDIAGATGASLTLNDVSRAHAGTYSVRVTGKDGSTMSETSVLAVRGRLKPNPPQWLGNGALRLGFANEFGDAVRAADLDRYNIEVSEDMNTWTAFRGPKQVANGRLQVDDATANESPKRFYRVVQK